MDDVVDYCEKYGIYQLYKQSGNTIVWYSYFGDGNWYKTVHNVRTGFNKRTHLRYRKCPMFLINKEGHALYNYYCG